MMLLLLASALAVYVPDVFRIKSYKDGRFFYVLPYRHSDGSSPRVNLKKDKITYWRYESSTKRLKSMDGADDYLNVSGSVNPLIVYPAESARNSKFDFADDKNGTVKIMSMSKCVTASSKDDIEIETCRDSDNQLFVLESEEDLKRFESVKETIEPRLSEIEQSIDELKKSITRCSYCRKRVNNSLHNFVKHHHHHE